MMKKGMVTTWVLTFSVITLIMLGGMVGFVLLQKKVSTHNAASEQSLHIAEAGVNYYKWLINQNTTTTQVQIQDHNDWCTSSDTVSVCGSEDWCGPYEHEYKDTDGNVIGSFLICAQAKYICNQILGVSAKSIGYTSKYPDIQRSIQAKFAATSIADYAYLINESVWAGDDRSIYGKYHSNNGIKMDGTGNSIVSSARDTWLCTSSYGCDKQNCPDVCTREGDACRCPGVFGDGAGDDLWKYPVTPFDFNGLTADFNKIKVLAQSEGHYYPPSIDIDSSALGYHVIFNSDGSFDIRIITEITEINSSDGSSFKWKPEIIEDEYAYQTNVTTTDCGLIYVEDDLWVDGTVKGRKTIASANLISQNIDTTAIINWNIDYTTLDGTDSFALLAEQDILIPLCSPGGNGDSSDLCHRTGYTDKMTIRGVYVAQKGKFGRNYYPQIKKKGKKWVSYHPWSLRNELLIHGSIVSNKRVGTKWVCGWGYCSGYEDRENIFDQKLATNPPPLLPFVSPDLKIVSWEEL